MPEIGSSGLMSGDGKRSVAEWPKLPRPSSTLPKCEVPRHPPYRRYRRESGSDSDIVNPPRLTPSGHTIYPAHQVLHNRESSALQYAMRDRLTALGWSRIETVDDDLGRSAAGGVARAGFGRMVPEVCLGKVGAVAAREVSRFARNSRDWQQLIEMCRVVDTVLIDQETVYAPRQGNDRLLLGLKGSLNEYE